MNIALLYEHPTWSDALIETFQSNGIDLKLINVADLSFRPDKERPGFNFAVNRINMMPSSRRNSSVVPEAELPDMTPMMNWKPLLNPAKSI